MGAIMGRHDHEGDYQLCPACEQGQWAIETATNSYYLIDLDAMTQVRLPDPQSLAAAARADDREPEWPLTYSMRRDAEPIRVLDIATVRLGGPLIMWLDVRRDGVSTYRVTSDVVAVRRLRSEPP